MKINIFCVNFQLGVVEGVENLFCLDFVDRKKKTHKTEMNVKERERTSSEKEREGGKDSSQNYLRSHDCTHRLRIVFGTYQVCN